MKTLEVTDIKTALQNLTENNEAPTDPNLCSVMLLEICSWANLDCLNTLLNAGANLEIRDDVGCTPLSLVSCSKCHEVMRLFIERGAHLEARDEDGWTPLIYAINSYDKPGALILIEAGANVNNKYDYGWTPLMWAVGKNLEEVIPDLIEAGADVNAMNEETKWGGFGKSPLSLAEEKGNIRVINMLKEARE